MANPDLQVLFGAGQGTTPGRVGAVDIMRIVTGQMSAQDEPVALKEEAGKRGTLMAATSRQGSAISLS